MDHLHKNILFFDSYCNLCNGLINFLIKHDTQKSIHFAGLNGLTAKKLLQADFLASNNSVLFFYKNKLYKKSTAAILAVSLLGFPWKLCLVLLVFPRFLRDPFYDFVAQNRYAWFGKRDTCRLATEKEREQFLD